MQILENKPLREYRIARGWRIFIFLFMPPFTLLFLSLGIILPFQMEKGQEMAYLLSPVGLGMSAIFIYGLLDTIKGRLRIYADKIALTDPFKTKELYFSNIRGFRVTDQYTFIYAKAGKPKVLKVSAYLGNYNELVMWLHTNFINLEVVEAVQEEEQILADIAYGRNTYEREQKLKGARKVAKVLNWAGVAIGLWLFFAPFYYDMAIATGLLFPIPVIVAAFFYRGLIRLNDGKGSAYPAVGLAILMPSFGLALRAILDISLLELTPLLLPAAGLTLLPLLLLLTASRELAIKQAKDLLIPCLLVFLFSGYGFGGAAFINCLYDTAPATTYKAEVLEKRISTGKTTTYYLELSPWGPRTEAEEVSVDKALYEYIDTGASVEVYLKPGLLEVPWFWVSTAE